MIKWFELLVWIGYSLCHTTRVRLVSVRVQGALCHITRVHLVSLRVQSVEITMVKFNSMSFFVYSEIFRLFIIRDMNLNVVFHWRNNSKCLNMARLKPE